MTTSTPVQQASQEEEVDIDALFDEAVAATTTSDDDASDTTTASAKKEGEENAEGDLDLSQNTVNEEATDKVASTEASGEKTQDAKSATDDAAKNDWRKLLTPEAKKAVEEIEAGQRLVAEENAKLRHRALSDSGRVAALTRRVEELSRAKKGESSADADKREALLTQLKADYPFIAEAIDAVRAESAEQVASAEKLAQKLADDQAAETQRKREDAVEASHAGWKQTVASPVFAEWLKAQSPDVKELAKSDEPQHAVQLLDAFREKHPATSDSSKEAAKEAEKDTTQQSAQQQGAAKVASKTAAEIKAEREKKLEASRGVETRQAVRESTTSEAVDGVEAEFDAEVRRREAQKKQQRKR